MAVRATYFRSAAAFRKWLATNHVTAKLLLVGFHKKGSGTPSMTWQESVDQALCFGWIDGVRKRVDETRYTIRFTPRRAHSTWSLINVNRAKELIARKVMQPAGRRAFEARQTRKTGLYSYENRPAELDEAYAKVFRRRDPAAWAFFQAQPPSYRKLANWWVSSAKKDETRQKRLDRLIADSAAGKRI